MIKVGDTVTWRGGFGSFAPEQVEVTYMEVTDGPREKYGEQVSEVSEKLIRANRVVFGLSSGNWAYSDQIDL